MLFAVYKGQSSISHPFSSYFCERDGTRRPAGDEPRLDPQHPRLGRSVHSVPPRLARALAGWMELSAVRPVLARLGRARGGS